VLGWLPGRQQQRQSEQHSSNSLLLLLLLKLAGVGAQLVVLQQRGVLDRIHPTSQHLVTTSANCTSSSSSSATQQGAILAGLTARLGKLKLRSRGHTSVAALLLLLLLLQLAFTQQQQTRRGLVCVTVWLALRLP
jgi:hypothetical protein